MTDTSEKQKQRLSQKIDSMFPDLAKKGQLMANLADARGDYSILAEMSESELEEMIAMEKRYIGA